MVERVLVREEIYHGDGAGDGPDLVVEWADGYVGDAGLSGAGRLVTSAPPGHSSDHWNQSAFLAAGAGVRSGALDAALEDIAPTVLQALGVSPPAGLGGRVLPIMEAGA
jgi:predicted AlkP superfamily phosphohydrolase/phosphomutase